MYVFVYPLHSSCLAHSSHNRPLLTVGYIRQLGISNASLLRTYVYAKLCLINIIVLLFLS